MQLNQRDVTKNFRTGYYLPATPGSNAGVGAPRFFFGFRPSESRRESDADILGALSVLAFAPYPARLKVIGKITATGRRCWVYSRALIAEWRRRARSRGELRTFGDRQLLDIGITRLDAENEAMKLFWQQ